MSKSYIGIGVILIILLISCNNGPRIPDVSDIKVDYNLVRFEHQLRHIDTTNVKGAIRYLEKEFPSFSKLYFSNVIPTVRDKKDFESILKGYVNDSTTQDLFDIVELQYGDFNTINKQFKHSFKLLKHYFPETTIPDIYTFISSFGYQGFIFNVDDHKDGIGIGLDMYLKDKIPYKSYFPKEPQFSDYMTRSFDKNHIVRKSLKLLIDDKLGHTRETNLLSQMIDNGKKLYLLDHLLPLVSDTIITEYSLEQLNWCEMNEYEIWTFFRNESLLYENRAKKISPYINPAPYAPGMEKIAPGRVANYIGWNIIKSYMNQYPETDMKSLMKLDNAQQLLKKSKYKPRRKN